MGLNEIWMRYIKDNGADFVHFVDISMLPADITHEYSCAVLFGKALTKEFIKALKNSQKPACGDEFDKTEHEMDALADMLADKLNSDSYKSISNFEFAKLPHKTIARIAGFGFIGKNTLLINEEYGCAVILGKVLTDAPFSLMRTQPKDPLCGDCNICVDTCPDKALSGKLWNLTICREEMLDEKLCTTCLKCMINCPYTERYMEGSCI